MDTNFYSQLCEQEEKLLKRLDAIRVLKANYIEEENALSSLKNTIPATPLDGYPTNYDKELSLKQKVYVALYRIHKGFADDIAVSLHQLDNDITLEKAKYLSTGIASDLFRKKVIGAERFGKKYRYFIKI